MAVEVSEIFLSIQGESSWSGQPCVFIRLTGCNLRCAYCDTSYAYEQGRFMDIAEILERVRQLRCDLVEVTGGEPLIQAETPSLIRRLLDAGHTVLLETNGSIDIGMVDPRCVRIMDIKCPSSGMAGQNDLRNLEKLGAQDELKFVIGSREDYEFARDLVRQTYIRHSAKERHIDCGRPSAMCLAERGRRPLILDALPDLSMTRDGALAERLLTTIPAARCKINFSPVFGSLAPRSLAEWILEDHLPVRLNLQLHKIIWGPEARGV
ncbi:MAG: radical SAM protein [Syntrophobacteraceae bacterium]